MVSRPVSRPRVRSPLRAVDPAHASYEVPTGRGPLAAPQHPAKFIQRLQQYVRDCQAIFRLQDWDIKLLRDMSPEGSHADIVAGMWTADLRLGPSFRAQTPELQRRIIAHELAHIYTNQLIETVYAVVPPDKNVQFNAVFRDQIEWTTEQLERVLAPLLPLPPTK